MSESSKSNDSKQKNSKQGFASSMRPLLVLLGRRARSNLTKTIVIGSFAILVIVGMGSLWQIVGQKVDDVSSGPTVQDALDALSAKRFSEARDLASKLQYATDLPAEDLGGPAFVLGAVTAYEAAQLWGKNETRRHRLAANYLEEARDRGFPEGRQWEGLYLLGRSLYASKQYAPSRTALREAMRYADGVAVEERLNALNLLVDAYLQDRKSDLSEVVEFDKMYLAEEGLSAEDREQGLLRRAQIQFRLNQYAAAEATIQQIPAASRIRGRAMIVLARVGMANAKALADQQPEGDDARKAYGQMLNVLRDVKNLDVLGPEARRQADYLIGLSLMRLGETAAALKQFTMTRKKYFESEEGVAAGVWEASLQQSLGDYDASISSYRRMLHVITSPEYSRNQWLARKEMELQFRLDFQSVVDAGQYHYAVQFAELLALVFEPEETVQMRARAQVAWAGAIETQVGVTRGVDGSKLLREARQHYRRAGEVYMELARLRYATRSYPGDLWAAAENLLRGQSYESAVRVIEEYRKHEPRKKRGLALVGQGEARLALGQVDESLLALRECIDELPNDPAVYGARILAGRAHMERDEVEIAERYLRANKNSLHLTPASPEWRRSLFALGHLFYSAERYQEAIDNLEEAVDRYPEDPEAMESRYLIAEAYRHAAREPLEKLQTVTIETNRAIYTAEVKRLLNKSIRQYELVQKTLNQESDATKMTALERAILRNCYFARGALFFELGRFDSDSYEQAIRAYSTATNLYQHEPEVLDAFLQIATCYRRLGRPVEARGTLEQARVFLKQLDDSVGFQDTTNFNRREWGELLDWMIAT